MRKIIYILLILCLLIPLFPIETKAITLGEYEAKLNKYKTDAENNQKAINKTESQINQANADIQYIKQEMKNMANEIEEMQEEIVKYNAEIKKKGEQTKEIVAYYQLSEGENVYLEYLFGADNITDLIYRSSIVEQLTAYNNQVIDELENMIKANKQREVELNNKEKQLQEKEKYLAQKVVELGEEKSSLSVASVSISQQIKIYQELVTSYKKAGCKSSDVIGVDCAVQGEAGVFRRPTKTGYVTSEFGFRWGRLHRGIDISSSKKTGEKIYPIANGKIIAKYQDSSGALILAIEHYSSAKGKWYTSLYGHMSSYAPGLYVGKNVTSEQYIGYMGNTGYSFGVHLHMEVIPCRLYNWSDRNCSTWNGYVNYANKLANQGYKGPRSLINFPKGTYKSWSTR